MKSLSMNSIGFALHCIALPFSAGMDGGSQPINQLIIDFWMNESMNESMNEWIDSDWNDWTPLKLMNDWVISHDDEAWLAALTHHWPTWAAQSASKRAGPCLQRCQINVGHPRHWPKSGKAAGLHFICSIGPALNSVANWPIKCQAGNLATFLALLPHFCSLWWPLVAFGGLLRPFVCKFLAVPQPRFSVGFWVEPLQLDCDQNPSRINYHQVPSEQRARSAQRPTAE